MLAAESIADRYRVMRVSLNQGMPNFSRWYPGSAVRKVLDARLKAESDKTGVEPEPSDSKPLKMKPRRFPKALCSSVMTSCTARRLPDLIAEIRRPNILFDPLMLRAEDIKHMQLEKIPLANCETAAGVLSTHENIPRVAKWLVTHLANGGAKVGALATYFPQITSLTKVDQEEAINAIVGCVRIAQELKARELMALPVVEIVCGTITDTCHCDRCAKKPDIFESTPQAKFEQLRHALREVRKRVTGDYFLAVEMEPGATYLLNGIERLMMFNDLVMNDKVLRANVGFNLDIAHMRIAEIGAAELEPLMPRVLHAHISDHPFMHTRDQPVGKWTSVECDPEGGYAPYVWLLAKRYDATSDLDGDELPFTGAVALELEGCDRIAWVRQSLDSMDHLFASLIA
jgi:sugar phosphate isomerase/epimerase